jgi:hypothetical protein
MLLPKKVEGLLLAGRCVSCNHRAFGAVRIIPTCMVMGQAAGTAAALASEKHQMPTDLDAAELQQRLAEAGVFLHPEEADRRFEVAAIGP